MTGRTLASILAAAEGILAPLNPAVDVGALDRAVLGFEFHQPGGEGGDALLAD